jgi:hypothetical protein
MQSIPDLAPRIKPPVNGTRLYIVNDEAVATRLGALGLRAFRADGESTDWRDIVDFPEIGIIRENGDASMKFAISCARSLKALNYAGDLRTISPAGAPDLAGNSVAELLIGDADEVRARLDAIYNAMCNILGAPERPAESEPANPEPEQSKDKKAEQVSQAEKLVRLALELYRIGRAEGDEPFAVPHDGPNVALMFRGSRDALRSALAREYRRRHGTTPNASALADALTALQGEAYEQTPEPVYLRLAEHAGGIVLDLGGADGRAVVIRSGGWELVDKSPVLFKRTALTGTLPEPERGGDLAELRGLLNVTDNSWPLVVSWLTAALLPNIPHPVLMLGGQQGDGKTTMARMLVSLFDPSPALLRSQPREPEAWALAAAGSWGVVVDNVSYVTGWWSDALCRACTGDGWVRRRLYTDGELSVVSFKRVVVLTSIDAGALRGDLGDRLLLVDLEPIDDNQRRTESDLDAAYAALRPRLLGALLDLLAAVLARLPSVGHAPCRMADFGRVLMALDAELGTDALALYLAQRGRIAGDVLEGDPVGVTIVTMFSAVSRWSGTAAELLARITSERPGFGWPKNARALAGRLRRLIPALQVAGILVQTGDREAGTGRRLWHLEKCREVPSQPSHRHTEAAGDPENGVSAAEAVTKCDDTPATVTGDRHTETLDFDHENADSSACDGRDDVSPLPSGDPPDDLDQFERKAIVVMEQVAENDWWASRVERDENGETAAERAARWEREKAASVA